MASTGMPPSSVRRRRSRRRSPPARRLRRSLRGRDSLAHLPRHRHPPRARPRHPPAHRAIRQHIGPSASTSGQPPAHRGRVARGLERPRPADGGGRTPPPDRQLRRERAEARPPARDERSREPRRLSPRQITIVAAGAPPTRSGVLSGRQSSGEPERSASFRTRRRSCASSPPSWSRSTRTRPPPTASTSP